MADLNIGELDYGISISGAGEYKENLKAIVLTQVKNIIEEEKQNVLNALDKGWVGESRDKFDTLFKNKCSELETALEEEYNDLENRINELMQDYVNQDKEMIID